MPDTTTTSSRDANARQAAHPAPDQRVLHARSLHKHYRMGGQDLHILRGVDLDVQPGQWIAILGSSGSGKSTLLHLLGLLDRPDDGTLILAGRNASAMSSGQRDRCRFALTGFVFQFYHLLPELNALENVVVAAMVGRSIFDWPSLRAQTRQRAAQLLADLGLGDRLNHRPNRLSGGERQRVAIARAMINQPQLLLADEPTGNLDENTGRQIMQVFEQLHARGQTIIMVTHDQAVAAAADRRLTLHEGQLHEST